MTGRGRMQGRARGAMAGLPLARRWWLALWLLCALGAQTLGLVHGVVHAERSGHPLAAVHAHHAHETSEHAHGDAHASFVHALFASHGDAAQCVILDALMHGGPALPGAEPPAVPVAPPHAVPPYAGVRVARGAAAFDARGPPTQA